MGAFFLPVGCFTPRSFDSKGLLRFGLDRLLRLGLPLLVYGLLIGPFTLALTAAHNGASVLEAWNHLLMRPTFNIGPLWFAWALLIISGAYALIRTLNGQRAGAFLLRLWVPTGEQRWSLQIGFFILYRVVRLGLSGGSCAPARTYRRLDCCAVGMD